MMNELIYMQYRITVGLTQNRQVTKGYQQQGSYSNVNSFTFRPSILYEYGSVALTISSC